VTTRDPIRLTAQELARLAHGELLHGAADQVIDQFSIDTRALAVGDLFIALRGEKFDGHRFVGAALEKRAVGALIADAAAWPAGASGVAILVPDTLRALQQLAAHLRRESGTPVIAVTGSAGKTTTKEVIAEFLSARHEVFRNRGNLNNHIGLPLSLLELRHRPSVAVVEFGMNHAGEIRTLVEIARPDVRVWTNVGDAHLGFFASADAIADAKAEVLDAASPRDVLVANADDDRIMSRAGRFAGRTITFGIDRDAQVRAHDVEDRGVRGMRARVVTPVGEETLQIPLLGRGNLANVIAAVAVALHFGIPLEEIAPRAAALRPASHRGEVVRLRNGATVIDDSYNSSPSALRQALDVVARSQGYTRKAAVLGEMLELGDHARRLHESCGVVAAGAGLSWLVSVGGATAAALARAARGAGMDDRSVVHVEDSGQAAEVALSRVRSGDLILVKGSHGIATDRVVGRLKEAAA
jgi:UDP-N-acetylmuramoyl-tripeptide--D-alanyl-D-alanine ligase